MAVWLRKFQMDDIDSIDEIFNRRGKDIGIPSLKNVIVNSTIVQDNKVIGYGVVKAYAEAVLILDPTIRKRSKAAAVVNGLDFAIEQCKIAGVEQVFIFSNDKNYTKLLKKHYGFKETSGTTLFIELDEDKEKSN